MSYDDLILGNLAPRALEIIRSAGPLGSCTALADQLNAERVPTQIHDRGHTGETWHSSRVLRIRKRIFAQEATP